MGENTRNVNRLGISRCQAGSEYVAWLHSYHMSPARPSLFLSTDTNSTHTDAFSTWSLLWPLVPRTYINACKLFFSVPLFHKGNSFTKLVLVFITCFFSQVDGTHYEQKPCCYTFNIPSSLVSPTSSHAAWIDCKHLSRWPTMILLDSRTSAGRSHGSFLLNGTTNQSV